MLELLLDASWHVHVWKQVDGKYIAVAARRGEKLVEILPTVDIIEGDTLLGTEDRFVKTSEGAPSQFATANSPGVAIKELYLKVMNDS